MFDPIPLSPAALRGAPWILGSCFTAVHILLSYIIIARQLGGVSARVDAMAMETAGKPGGGFDVDRVLDFEKRSGIKDGEIESFITKVDAVNAAIQAMKARESRPRGGGSCVRGNDKSSGQKLVGL